MVLSRSYSRAPFRPLPGVTRAVFPAGLRRALCLPLLFRAGTEPRKHTNLPEMAGLGVRLRVGLLPGLLPAPWPRDLGRSVSSSVLFCIAVERCRGCWVAAFHCVLGFAAWRVHSVCCEPLGGPAVSAGGFPARGERRVGRSVQRGGRGSPDADDDAAPERGGRLE